MNLGDLEVYRLAREVSREFWEAYKGFDWHTKKVVGDQAMTAIDSVGANIAEGFGRFHYLDRNKFYYNARGSLQESIHWVEILGERNLLKSEQEKDILVKLNRLNVKLNNFITANRKQKAKETE